MTSILLPIVGFLIGLLVVTLGGGGGMFYVGLLTACFGVPPAIAASTSLATIIPTTAAGALSHWRAGNVRPKLGLIMLISAALGAIVGSLCSAVLPHDIYGKLLGGFMLVLGFQMLFSDLKKKRHRGKDTHDKEPKKGYGITTILTAGVYGFFGGIMSGLIGLSGSGPILVGLSVLGCDALETIGTSVFVLVGISITGFLMHLRLGSVEWKLVSLLLIGTASGAFVGPMLLTRLDRTKIEKFLQPLIHIFVFGVGIALLAD